METKELTNIEKVSQKIQLVKGEFTLSEAAYVITRLIDEKINFHKLQRLQATEANHQSDTGELNGRIKELEKEKEIARQHINTLRGLGQNLKIDGVLEITIAQ